METNRQPTDHLAALQVALADFLHTAVTLRNASALSPERAFDAVTAVLQQGAPLPLITDERRDEIRQRHHEDDLRDRAMERRERVERGDDERQFGDRYSL